jgi:hypothetical protein
MVVDAGVQALLESVHYSPPESVRPCDIQKLAEILKFGKACGTDGIPYECLRHSPRKPLVHPAHYLTTASGYNIF